jgi:pimeloyl-ACP methyl ester carboxylesterase
MKLPKAKVKDLNVYYEVEGKGFPLIMVMGLGGNKDWWGPPLVSAISKKYKTIIFDNRGTGRTDTPETSFTIKAMADDTVGLMDALKIGKAHVLGISLGGMVAQELVLNHPDRVEKLVLCATMCGASHSVMNLEVVAQLQSGGGQTPAEFIKAVTSLLFPPEFMKANPKVTEEATRLMLIAPTRPDMYLRQLGATISFDTYERLPTIKVPTLVMHGKKDLLIPWQNAKIIADRIPGAKLVHFEKTGHALFSVETEAALKVLFQFLG